MKTFKYGALFIFLCLWFGLIGPWMVSANNDIPVIGWTLLTIAGIIYAFHIIKGKFK